MKNNRRFPWRIGSLLRDSKGYRFVVMEIHEGKGEPASCFLQQVYTQKEKNEAYAPPWDGWFKQGDFLDNEMKLERLA